MYDATHVYSASPPLEYLLIQGPPHFFEFIHPNTNAHELLPSQYHMDTGDCSLTHRDTVDKLELVELTM